MNEPNPKCTVCGGETVKVINSPAIVRVCREGGTPIRNKRYKEDYAKNYQRRVSDETQRETAEVNMT